MRVKLKPSKLLDMMTETFDKRIITSIKVTMVKLKTHIYCMLQIFVVSEGRHDAAWPC
jgi:hypothetical protein